MLTFEARSQIASSKVLIQLADSGRFPRRKRRLLSPGLNNACPGQVIDAHGVVSLAISQHEKDLAFLQYMFDGADWTLYKARTYREGMVELSRNRLHVTVCECQLPDGTWKDVLSHLAPWPERPRLIVISNHADERLWAEVLAMGGFEVLATPLKETEAAYAIGSAWLDWENENQRAKKTASMPVSR